MRESKALFKVAGYGDYAGVAVAELDRGEGGGEGGGERMSALHALAAFLAALTNADADGRVIVDGTAGTLRFVLLNAAAHFSKACARPNCPTLKANPVLFAVKFDANDAGETLRFVLLNAAVNSARSGGHDFPDCDDSWRRSGPSPRQGPKEAHRKEANESRRAGGVPMHWRCAALACQPMKEPSARPSSDLNPAVSIREDPSYPLL